MESRIRKGLLSLVAGFMVAGLPGVGVASEGGGTQYTGGAEHFMGGVAPPPGDYLINYSIYYSAGRANDARGHGIPVSFGLNVEADAIRYMHVSNVEVLGGNWLFYAVEGVARQEVSVGGRHQIKVGATDPLVDPVAVGWHAGNFHWVAGVDLMLPTGAYDKKDLSNIGHHYLGIQPLFGFTYLNAEGVEASIKLMYVFNTRNEATRYQSGQDFHTDFIVGKHFDGWTAGIGGYALQQTSDDSVNGVTVADARGRVIALGPRASFRLGTVGVTASWDHEMAVQNRPVGDKGWLKLFIPL